MEFLVYIFYDISIKIQSYLAIIYLINILNSTSLMNDIFLIEER